LEQSVSATPTLPQWAQGAAIAGGALAAGALLDKPVDRFMSRHQGAGALRAWGDLAKALPVALVSTSGAAVLFGDARMENMGWISLQSAAGAAALSIGAKHLVGRARPTENQGPWSTSADRSNASFPSNHASVAFAAVTPFAQEYDAPWLYGLVAAGSLGRTANRQHWVSDVVAGGLLGYAMGDWLWKAQRNNTASQFAVTPGRRSLGVAWAGSY
jgi:membrane-associated phospholipid phosphatase